MKIAIPGLTKNWSSLVSGPQQTRRAGWGKGIWREQVCSSAYTGYWILSLVDCGSGSYWNISVIFTWCLHLPHRLPAPFLPPEISPANINLQCLSKQVPQHSYASEIFKTRPVITGQRASCGAFTSNVVWAYNQKREQNGHILKTHKKIWNKQTNPPPVPNSPEKKPSLWLNNNTFTLSYLNIIY